MKWVFYVLLAINLVLLAVQWLNHRETNTAPVYQEVERGKRILLLHEAEDLSKLSEGGRRCLLIGPTLNEKSAGDLLGVLESDQAQLVVKDVEKAPGYWVYFEKQGNESEMVLKLNEFQFRQIESFIISEGKLKGAISLGVFENIDLARGLKKKMKKNGYSVKISEINKVEKEYWLLLGADYAAENNKKIKEIVTPFIKNQEMREIFCKSVASEKQFT